MAYANVSHISIQHANSKDAPTVVAYANASLISLQHANTKDAPIEWLMLILATSCGDHQYSGGYQCMETLVFTLTAEHLVSLLAF